jgi:hypothetical protein
MMGLAVSKPWHFKQRLSLESVIETLSGVGRECSEGQSRTAAIVEND